MKTENYSNKGIGYFNKARYDLIGLMPIDTEQKVLEIGMGAGDTLVEIKKRKLAKEVTGIDLMKIEGSNQENPLIDFVHYIDLDKEELPLEDNYYDVIIAGDVFEHLVNPEDILKKLIAKLKKKGCLLISLPNIRAYNALYSIVFKGRFEYTSEGIFDKTHLRFFCKKDMIQMIQSAGDLQIEIATPIHLVTSKNSKRELFNKFTFKIFEEFTTVQYLFKVIKN